MNTLKWSLIILIIKSGRKISSTRYMYGYILKAAFFFILYTEFSTSLYAQSPWLNRQYQSHFGIEWIKPSFDFNLDDNDDISFLTSVLFINARIQVNDRFWFITEIPFSHWELNDEDGIDDQDPHTTIGNIYLGGEYNIPNRNDRAGSFLEIGVHVPTMPDPFFLIRGEVLLDC